jgi:hypothetical protein
MADVPDEIREAVLQNWIGSPEYVYGTESDAQFAVAAVYPLIHQRGFAEGRAAAAKEIARKQRSLRRRMSREGWMGHNTDPEVCSSCDPFIAIALEVGRSH